MLTSTASEPHPQVLALLRGFHQAKGTLWVNQENTNPLRWKAMPIPDKTAEERKAKS